MIEGLSIRLYLDHNVDAQLAVDLRARSFDVVRAAQVGNERLLDDEQLAWATAHGRALFSYDRKDYLRLAGEWLARDDHHAGIVLSLGPPALPYGRLLRRLLRLLDTVTADEIAGHLRWLDASFDR